MKDACGRDTLAVSNPSPELAPVTMMTLSDRSGISSTVNLDLGGKDSEATATADIRRPIVRNGKDSIDVMKEGEALLP